MKCLMYGLDNGVVIGSVSEKILAGMMGAGGLVKEGQIDREVAKFLMETEADEALLKVSVPDLLALRAGPYEVAVRAFVEACCFGGLTEAEALMAIAGKDAPETGLEHIEIIEDTDLPSDRYFRNAWEWSD
jgi:hypothetical protein